MIGLDFKRLTTPELLKCFAGILDEMKERGVSRTLNNPVSDCAEWLVAEKLKLRLAGNSNAGYDARGADGKRYQIKGRRLTSPTASRQLSIIRNLEGNTFDYLVAVVFRRDFELEVAYSIPHNVIGQFARFSSHVNGHILHLRGALLTAKGVEEITEKLRDAPRA